MRNSVLFCGKHKADNPAGSPSFQVPLLALQVLDNSCNHLPLYRNPDHALYQINMLRGYAHHDSFSTSQLPADTVSQAALLHSLFFIPFLLFFTCGTISLQDVAASEYYERSIVMEINFTSQELLFLYGHFKLEAQKLEALKATPGCPISSENLDSDIKFYKSIAQKLSDCEPKLLNMNPYLEQIKK